MRFLQYQLTITQITGLLHNLRLSLIITGRQADGQPISVVLIVDLFGGDLSLDATLTVG